MTNGQWELEELEAMYIRAPRDLYPAGGSMGAWDQCTLQQAKTKFPLGRSF